MIKMVRDTFTDAENVRERTFQYNSQTDEELLKRMETFLIDNQPTCFNCQNSTIEGTFCGYQAHNCKIHGNIEAFDNPHHDGDGSKCEDYKRRKVIKNHTDDRVEELKEEIVDLRMQLVKANIPDGNCPYAYYTIEGATGPCHDCDKCKQNFMESMRKMIEEEVKNM